MCYTSTSLEKSMQRLVYSEDMVAKREIKVGHEKIFMCLVKKSYLFENVIFSIKLCLYTYSYNKV